MTRRFALTCVCSLLAATAVAELPEAARGYVLDTDASDEFDGAELDENRWTPWNPSFPGRSAGFLFASDNVAVKDGRVRLTARFLREDEKTPENLLRGYDTYATGTIKSKAKCLYGYFECRAKTMRANVCNAFWLYDPHSGDRKAKFTAGDVSEEIDIFEVTSRADFKGEYDCRRIYYNTLHAYRTPYLEGVVSLYKQQLDGYSGKTKVDFDFCDDFHVYGFLWTPAELVWYLDGKVTYRRKNDIFHRPLHVTFDSEIMYDWFGIPDPKDLPATFEIDWFRRWRSASPAEP